MNNSYATPVSEAASDRAIEWFARLRADDVTEADRQRFFVWLGENRENQQAFVETLKLWEDAAIVKQLSMDDLKPFPVVWDFKQRTEAKSVSR